MMAFVGWIDRRGHTVSAEMHKALIRRFLEAHARGDLDTLEEMLAPDFVNHNLLPGQEPAREVRKGYLQSVAEYHAAFSDSRYSSRSRWPKGTRW
jgi:ketosteroid isomerase-like protein